MGVYIDDFCVLVRGFLSIDHLLNILLVIYFFSVFQKSLCTTDGNDLQTNLMTSQRSFLHDKCHETVESGAQSQ